MLDTPGGMALGLLAQRNETLRAEDRRLGARVRTLLTEPFDIRNGEQLRFVLHDDATVAAPSADLDPSDRRSDAPGPVPAPHNWPRTSPPTSPPTSRRCPWCGRRAGAITLFTRGTGHARRFGLQGTALPSLGATCSRVPVAPTAQPTMRCRPSPSSTSRRRPAPSAPSTSRERHSRVTARHGTRHRCRVRGSTRARSQQAGGAAAQHSRPTSSSGRTRSTAGSGSRAVPDRTPNIVGTGAAEFAIQPASPARSFSINGRRTFTFTTTAPPPPDQVRIREQDPPPPPPTPPPPPVRRRSRPRRSTCSPECWTPPTQQMSPRSNSSMRSDGRLRPQCPRRAGARRPRPEPDT